MLKKIFNKLIPNKKVQFDDFELSEDAMKSLSTFANRSKNERMGDMMMLGDKGNHNFFYLLYYAVLYDTDKNVRFAVMKRLHNFKDHPYFEKLLEELAKPAVGEDLQPYYNMMLLNVGKITEEEFNEMLNK